MSLGKVGQVWEQHHKTLWLAQKGKSPWHRPPNLSWILLRNNPLRTGAFIWPVYKSRESMNPGLESVEEVLSDGVRSWSPRGGAGRGQASTVLRARNCHPAEGNCLSGNRIHGSPSRVSDAKGRRQRPPSTSERPQVLPSLSFTRENIGLRALLRFKSSELEITFLDYFYSALKGLNS